MGRATGPPTGVSAISRGFTSRHAPATGDAGVGGAQAIDETLGSISANDSPTSVTDGELISSALAHKAQVKQQYVLLTKEEEDLEVQIKELEDRRSELRQQKSEFFSFTVMPAVRASEWVSAGFSEEEGIAWSRAVRRDDPDAARAWIEKGLTADEVFDMVNNARQVVSANTYGKGRQGRFYAFAGLNSSYRDSLLGVEPWLRFGFDVEDIPKWTRVPQVESTEQAAGWRDAGFSSTEAGRWSPGYPKPDDIFSGLSGAEAKGLKAVGVNPKEPSTWTKCLDEHGNVVEYAG